jgi:hypothetical protein
MAKYLPLEHHELKPDLQKALPTDASFKTRITIAKGLVPLGTADLLSALYYLCGDPDKRIRTSAQVSLRELPEALIFVGVNAETHTKLLHFLATRKFDNENIHIKVALHNRVTDPTLAFIALHTEKEHVIEVVTKNEAAILRHPSILWALSNNENCPKHILDRLTQFYEVQKKHSYVEDITSNQRKVIEEARKELKPRKKKAAVEKKDEVAKDGQPAFSMPDDRLHPGFRVSDLLNSEFDDEGIFSLDLMKDADTPLEADEKGPLVQRIGQMNMVDRMLLALHGNAEARQFLIRTPNKMIQECVMRNPKITTREIVGLTKEKSTSQNVLDSISRNREWTRNYEIIHQLCWNPKTTNSYILRFLPRLNLKDIRKLSKSKMVAQFTANQARNLALRMEKNR